MGRFIKELTNLTKATCERENEASKVVDVRLEESLRLSLTKFEAGAFESIDEEGIAMSTKM
jgi:hypothetical protein